MGYRYGRRRGRYGYARDYSYSYGGGYGGWAPYVPVAERRRQAAARAESLRKKGQATQPVVIEGSAIARTFWGKAWCDNLEAYSDYSNRLPRGRTYVRNGSVIDLSIGEGVVRALVSGSSIYTVKVAVNPLPKDRWQSIIRECSGSIDSVVELLSGRLAHGVMDVLCRRGEGLFPTPREIELDCSCPDSAVMCKHVASTLYGVGARLDHNPDLLFTLRKVDGLDLVQGATAAGKLGDRPRATGPSDLDTADLGEIFGIEMDPSGATASPAAPLPPPPTAGRIGRPSAGARAASPATIGGSAAIRAPRAEAAARPARRLKGGLTPRGRRATRNEVARKPRVKLYDLLTADDLIARGIPRTTFQNWVKAGILLRTEKRGLYLATRDTQDRIDRARRNR